MSTYKESVRLASYAGLRELIQQRGILGALTLAKECGYTSAELLYISHECDTILNEANEWRDAIAKVGISISCISCYVDIVTKHAPFAVDDRSVEAVKRCIDLAEKIGCPLVHHTLVTRLSGGREEYSEVFPYALAAASEIADYASERKICVIYEPQGMLFNGLDGYSKLFDAMLTKHDNVGICLDVGNTLWVDEDCYTLTEKYAKHIKHVHVKDYVLGVNDSTYRTLSGTTIKEVRLGTGIIDLKRVFNILTKSGYRGAFSNEDNSGLSYEANAKNALGILMK